LTLPRLHATYDTVPFISAVVVFFFILAGVSTSAQEKPNGLPTGQGTRMSSEDAKKLKNPVPFTKKSIAQGRTTFQRFCTGCHGADGKAQVDVVADATDLTSPNLYNSGTSDGEIFRSVRDGAGETMPPFQTQITNETDLWHLVNFIHSLWPESLRPPLKDQ